MISPPLRIIPLNGLCVISASCHGTAKYSYRLPVVLKTLQKNIELHKVFLFFQRTTIFIISLSE